MSAVFVTVFCVSLALWLSSRAEAAFGAHDRLPVTFSLSGHPRAYAARRRALWIMPQLMVGCLALVLLVAPPGSLALPALIGAAFVAAHALHLWLIARAVSS